MTKLKQELNDIEAQGVISKVQQPTQWCAGMVIVSKKSGGVRVCVDLKPLNRCVLREHHPLPKVDKVLAQLTGATMFTIWLSVQRLIEQSRNVRASKMKLDSLAGVSAAISSSLGRVNCLSGATLALAILKDVLLSAHKNATAPYAMGLASAKMCNFWCCFVVVLSLERYCLGIVTLVASWMSCAMFNL